MAGRGSRLAARFKKAVLDKEQERRDERSAHEARVEAAERARTTLFDELVAFATETGVVSAKRGADGVTLRFEERYLHFAPAADSERVSLEFEGVGDEQHSLYRQPELNEMWVYCRRRPVGREDRVPFWDQGLEALLVRALGMPDP